MAEPADINVDELRRRARRRLVGAVVLALGVAVIVPMLLETEQKPLGDDVSVKIPPVDTGKFVNRVNDGAAPANAPTPDVAPPAADATKAAPAAASSEAAVPRTQKYDTRVPDAPGGNVQGAGDAQTPPAAPTSPVVVTPLPAVPAQPSKPAADSAKSAESATHKQSDDAKASRSAAPPREGYAVQLAAFVDDREANSLAKSLKKSGYTAYTEPLKTSKGTLWRVRVGPYPSREAAVAALDKLKTEGQRGIVAAIK